MEVSHREELFDRVCPAACFSRGFEFDLLLDLEKFLFDKRLAFRIVEEIEDAAGFFVTSFSDDWKRCQQRALGAD
jgi:hypothetical protein